MGIWDFVKMIFSVIWYFVKMIFCGILIILFTDILGYLALGYHLIHYLHEFIAVEFFKFLWPKLDDGPCKSITGGLRMLFFIPLFCFFNVLDLFLKFLDFFIPDSWWKYS